MCCRKSLHRAALHALVPSISLACASNASAFSHLDSLLISGNPQLWQEVSITVSWLVCQQRVICGCSTGRQPDPERTSYDAYLYAFLIDVSLNASPLAFLSATCAPVRLGSKPFCLSREAKPTEPSCALTAHAACYCICKVQSCLQAVVFLMTFVSASVTWPVW